MEKEIRTLQLNVRDLQENPQSRHIEGYAVVFNSESVDLGGFREVILPTAITQGLIERSDVFMVFQHDMDKVLARSRNGEGSLKLTLYDHGLCFAFDAPNTDLGNEVLEYLRRGDVGECSFAFALDPNDKEADVWEKREDGSILRTINRIAGLYDCSIVWNAAYPQTSVSARSLEKIEELRADEDKPNPEEDLAEDEKKPVEGEDTPNEDNTPNEGEETPNEGEETPAEETPAEEEPTSSEDEPETPNEGEDTPEDEEEKRKKNKQTHTHNIMEKKFSLLKSIREIANGQPLSPENQAVCDLGKQEMRGLTVSGQIQLPTESRAAVSVTAEGEDVVVTDFTDILAPLHSKNVLAECGAKILTGLVGDVQIPSMTKSQVGWKSEIAAAGEGGSTFTHTLLQPKRLTAYIDVSKQFLAQDSLGAEQMLREELVNAMVQKLEDTIFGNAAGDATKPAGLFYGQTPTEVSDFAGLTALEATVESNDFLGEMKYVVSPSAKASLRSMSYGGKSTKMVWENNEIDGVQALSTTHVANPNFVYGDWSTLVVGNWGGWDLTIDPYSQAVNAVVRITINAFFDAKVVREGGLAFGTIGQ